VTDNPTAGPTGNGDALDRALRRLPVDIAPVHDLWPAIAAGIATPARVSAARVWTLRIAAGLACVALGTGLGYALLKERMSAGQGVAPSNQEIAGQVNSWLVKPVMQDVGYQKARTQLATEFFRRIADLPADDRARVQKGLKEIESGLRDLNDALKKNPDSILLQQLALSAYQQELEFMQNVTSLTHTVPESSQT
jgi:hypothetical protein